ncbi:hypothetical protein ACJJTC_007057 [Scirpophaga incertulas]
MYIVYTNLPSNLSSIKTSELIKMPNDDWKSYVHDPRIVCKYGAKCYQKNPEHHKNYKHPPQKFAMVNNSRNKKRYSPYTKRNNDQHAESSNKEEAKKDIESMSQRLEDFTTDFSQEASPSNIKFEKFSIPENLKYFENDREVIKQQFLVHMPDDFYKFYESLNDNNNIEKTLGSVNLQLIGPFDVLLGKLPILDNKDVYLTHWRFYYDPPEFQAVLKKKGNSQFHIGYYRDDPDNDPVFLAKNDSAKDCKIIPIAKNIFAAVYIHLQSEKNVSPFMAMACQKVIEKLKIAAEKYNFPLEEYNMKHRQADIITKTLHGAGIVVPYNKKTQLGYRNLTETDANLKKIFTRLKEATDQNEKDKILSELQPVITYANIAVDECDFGTGLEAGIDLFCSGLKELEPSALSCLKSAYSLLNREVFSKIIEAHIKYRRLSSNLSVLDILVA